MITGGLSKPSVIAPFTNHEQQFFNGIQRKVKCFSSLPFIKPPLPLAFVASAKYAPV